MELGLAATMRMAAAGRGGGGPPSSLDTFAAQSHAVFDLQEESYADGATIGTLTDQTGNARDATQATEANKPIAQTVGSMKVARFTGGVTNHYLRTSPWTELSQPNTIIAVSKFTDPGSSAYYMLDGLDGTRRHALLSHLGSWKVDAGTLTTISSDNGLWHVWVLETDATSKVFIDGGAAVLSANIGTQGLTGLSIGARYDSQASTMWPGDIAYLGLYDGNLRTDNLALLNSVCQALADRAGITWTDIT